MALVWDPTEKEWQAEVVKAARMGRWLTYHTYDSRRSSGGFPDLTLVRDTDLIFAELKTLRGKASDEQQGWLTRLEKTGVEVYLWRPSDVEQVYARLVAWAPAPTGNTGMSTARHDQGKSRS
jgi:hypothetical protein